jgi:hypothetical protein
MLLNGTAIGLLTLGLGLASPAPDKAVSACTKAREWAQSNLFRLPRSLEDFSTYSRLQRRAIFDALPNKEKEHLWVEHLAIYTGEFSELSMSEKAFVDSVANSVSALIGSPDRDARLKLLASEATEAIGLDKARSIFGKLGELDPSLIDVRGLSLAVPPTGYRAGAGFNAVTQASSFSPWRSEARFTLTQPSFFLSVRDGCQCHAGSSGDFCDGGTGPHSECVLDESCTGIGCGWLFLQTCNGNCTLVSEDQAILK